MTTAYGTKYAETQDLGIAEVAKLIRADIKAAVAAGELPGSLRYHVVIERYSMGQAVDVTACGMSDAEHFTEDEYGRKVRSTEAERVHQALTAITWAYNYDGSDSMTDYYHVRFAAHVLIQDEASARFEQGEKARKAAIKAVKAFLAGGGAIVRDGEAADGRWTVQQHGEVLGRLTRVTVGTPAGGTRRSYWAIKPDGVMALRPDAGQAVVVLLASAA